MANTHHPMYEALCLKHVFLSFILWKSKTRLLVYWLTQTSYSNLAVYKFWFSSSCWLFGKLYHLVWLAMFLKFYRSDSQSWLLSLPFSSAQVALCSAGCSRPHHSFTCDSPLWLAFTQVTSAPIQGISWYYVARSPNS